MTLREQYFAEEAQGIKHYIDVDTYIVRRLYENWDEDEWNNLIDKIEEGFVQRYDENGVSILPASWDEDNDEDWEGYYNYDAGDVSQGVAFFNNTISESNNSCKYSTQAAQSMNIRLNAIEKSILDKYGSVFEVLEND